MDMSVRDGCARVCVLKLVCVCVCARVRSWLGVYVARLKLLRCQNDTNVA